MLQSPELDGPTERFLIDDERRRAPVRRLRSAARLSSKPATPYEREEAGRAAGKAAAFAGAPRSIPWHRGDDYAQGWASGYSRVADNGMTGR